MSIDHRAVSGYGVEVLDNMIEDLDIYEECGESIEECLEWLLDGTDVDFHSVGNHFSGDVSYFIIIDDPLNKDMDKFIEEIKALDIDLGVESIKDLVWISEVCTW